MEGLRLIKFDDAEITRIMPESLKYKPEVIAISYAIKNAMDKLIAYAKRTSVYSAIDELPEEILDVLAVELRSQYYESDMSIETKRKIQKKTLLWYYRAGTPSAVREMIEAVFGSGEVLEWYQYGGKPYRFKIITDTALTENTMEHLEKTIQKVKNTRSHLDAIELSRSHLCDMYVGCVMENYGYGMAREEET
ncbi:MAG: phage tail protein I [Roseburia sp.]